MDAKLTRILTQIQKHSQALYALDQKTSSMKKIPDHTQTEIESRKKKYFAAKGRYEAALAQWKKSAEEEHELAKRDICEEIVRQLDRVGVELRSVSFEDFVVDEEDGVGV